MTSLSGGGGGGVSNEALDALLTNATSTGDAGSRADQFLGTTLNAKWTVTGTPGTQTVGKSNLSVVTTGSVFYSQPYTPSGSFQIECRCCLSGTLSSNRAAIAIGVGDSGAPASLANSVEMSLDWPTNGWSVFSQNVLVGSRVTIGLPTAGQYFYFRMSRTGVSTYSCQYSYDRVSWLAFANLTNTLTVANVWLTASDAGTAGQYMFDFFDVTV